MEKLFIYGTLGPGRPNEHIMLKIGGEWTPASLKGQLHQEGWGATMGYPALIVDPNGEEIKGHIFSSDNLKNHWASLDEFEGEEYDRQLVDVTLEDGTTTKAYVYALKQA